MTVGEAMRAAAGRLRVAGVEGPSRDVRLLMAEALGCSVDRLTLRDREILDAASAQTFEAYLVARERHRPVSQIIGRREFWGRNFAVTSNVLDPRPESETLVAAALAGPVGRRVLDLGTGSGALLLTLLAEWPHAQGTGTDASEAALGVAARNAAALGLDDRARFIRADWTTGLTEKFDVVVCNPPYIPAADVPSLAPDVRDWEPHAALTPGETGLEAYDHLAVALVEVLAPGGRAFFEFGEGQDASVRAIFEAQGYRDLRFHHDFDGRKRVLEVPNGSC